MLAFITTLRHPQNSVDYSRVEKLLADTLRSVANQTSVEYVIIVVGNKKPDFDLPERSVFVPVDFPAPAPPTGARTAREPFIWDKGTKLGVGLIAAQAYDPTHVMIFDADDFVHRGLAATIGADPDNQGWVIRDGLMYSRARNSYVRIGDFNERCGTCFIVPFDAYGVPANLDVTASQEAIAAAYSDRLWTIMGAHRDAEEWYRGHGRELNEFPYPAAVYHVDTGENHSGKSLTGFARPFDRTLEDDFGILPSRGPLSTLWAARGPGPLILASRKRLGRIRRQLSARLSGGLGPR